jgi:hypothetical protein
MSREPASFPLSDLGAHGNARMQFNDMTQTWDVYGNATWDETAKTFKYDYRSGTCGY